MTVGWFGLGAATEASEGKGVGTEGLESTRAPRISSCPGQLHTRAACGFLIAQSNLPCWQWYSSR